MVGLQGLCTAEMSWFRRGSTVIERGRIRSEVICDELDQNEAILNRIKEKKNLPGLAIYPGCSSDEGTCFDGSLAQ